MSSTRKRRAPHAHIVLAALLAASAAHAVTMYRWVDESGATHVSDKVPDKYRASAKAIDSAAYESSLPKKGPAHAEPPQKGPVQDRIDCVLTRTRSWVP